MLPNLLLRLSFSEVPPDSPQAQSETTTWSTLAIFGYFGWVLTNPDDWCRFAIVVAWLPFVFAAFGFVYVWKLHSMIDRHTAFLDHLENEMLSCGDKTEWAKFKAKGHEGKPLRTTTYWMWVALLLFTGVCGLTLTSISGIVCTSAETSALT
jgi:hypothetical protein